MNGLLKHIVGFASYVRIILMIYRGYFIMNGLLKHIVGFAS